ncbi:MAG: hypothetical protein DMG06_06720 [Acidobacteria bacterium]|nr:MAG: hypothetical protein DMG06_06720 [Acidobacteriota bacterium]
MYCGKGRKLWQESFEPCERSMVAGSGVNGHRLYGTQSLHGWITNAFEQQIPEREILTWHHVAYSQPTCYVSPLGSDVGDIEQNLCRELTLETQGPVLNITRATIAWEYGVRGSFEPIGRTDKGRSRKFRSRPAA